MSDQDPRTDEELMAAYVGGDQAAFHLIFGRYAPIIHAMVKRNLRNEDMAREFTQQTFFRMHGARNDFRLDGKLRPWLLTIAMNLVRGHWRKQKRRKHVDQDLDLKAAPIPEFSDMELEERSQLLHAALARLPPTQREVVELHWLQSLPYVEVAAIVGSSEGAVRVRAHRAYAKLREMLGDSI